MAEKLLIILNHLHGQLPPIIHRDIKPSNILLANGSGNSIGAIYLVDFGSVQTVANREHGTITVTGSYGYMPLEQFSGRTTTASDLYSLGMTLMYVMTGIHPADLTQENGRVKFDDFDVSPKYLRWLERLTHPYVNERFASAKSALTALTSEDPGYGRHQQIKPADSQVELCCDSQRIRLSVKQSGSLMRFYLLVHLVISAASILFWMSPGGSSSTLFHISSHFIYAAIYVVILLHGSWIVQTDRWLAPHFLDSLLITRIDKHAEHIVWIIIGFLWIGWTPKLLLIQLGMWIVAEIFSVNKFLIDQSTYVEELMIDRSRGISFTVYRKNLPALGRRKYQSRFEDINFIFYNPGYTFNKFLEDGKVVSSEKTVEISPQLSLSAGKIEYPIFLHKKLSKPELWWIGQELSDFLDLDLQVIYPTPQMPHGQTCGGGC